MRLNFTRACVCGAKTGRELRTARRRFSTQLKRERVAQTWRPDVSLAAVAQANGVHANHLTSDARRIVGWRGCRTLRTDFVLDALE